MDKDPLCPACQGRNVGRVGTGQYYCWDCYIEFALGHKGVRMFRVEADGELSRIDPDNMEGVIS